MNSQFTKRRMMKTRRATLVCSGGRSHPPPPLRSVLLKEVKPKSEALRILDECPSSDDEVCEEGALGKRDPDVLHHVNVRHRNLWLSRRSESRLRAGSSLCPSVLSPRSTIWQLFTRGIRSTSGLSQRRSTRMAVPTFTRSSRP